MLITLEIPDDVIWSVEQYISTQIRVTNDPITNAQVMTKLYASPTAFIVDGVHQMLNQVVHQYPPPPLRAQMEEAAKIEADIKAVSMPVVVTE